MKKNIMISIAFMLPVSLFADLMYQGKPIDALCFYNMAEKNPTVSLKTCGISESSGQTIAGQNKHLVNQGYTGFTYTVKTPGSSYVAHGYSYYKSYGQINGYDVVYAVNNSGGNGEFSNLMLVKRIGDNLQLKSIAGGDRCNGGVSDIKNDGKVFSYNVNVTPFDFLMLANNNANHLKAYDDLQACAACCVATANYQYTSGNQPVLSQLNLNQDASQAGAVPGMTYQTCFNKLLHAYTTNGKTSITPDQLNQFVQKFNQQCKPT